MSESRLARPRGRESLAREYAVIADRFRFHLNVADLPLEVAELVQQAHDALAKASALMRLNERQASVLLAEETRPKG
jgi:hypothetical protein